MFRSLEKIRDLLKATFGNSFVDYIIDDPNLVPLSQLPCICVVPVSTSIDIADNQRDIFTHIIDVIIIIDAKQELVKYKKEMIGTQFLTEKMESRNSSGTLMSNTILYVLRSNLSLGSNWYINNISNINYSLKLRGSTPNQFVTKESSCRLEIIEIGNRT